MASSMFAEQQFQVSTFRVNDRSSLFPARCGLNANKCFATCMFFFNLTSTFRGFLFLAVDLASPNKSLAGHGARLRGREPRDAQQAQVCAVHFARRATFLLYKQVDEVVELEAQSKSCQESLGDVGGNAIVPSLRLQSMQQVVVWNPLACCAGMASKCVKISDGTWTFSFFLL